MNIKQIMDIYEYHKKINNYEYRENIDPYEYKAKCRYL